MQNPGNNDNAVVDWTFRTNWFKLSENKYIPNLKKNIDFVYQDFCTQISKETNSGVKSFPELVEKSKSIDLLKKEIKKLKAAVNVSKQFNRKLELNLKLKHAETELKKLLV